MNVTGCVSSVPTSFIEVQANEEKARRRLFIHIAVLPSHLIVTGAAEWENAASSSSKDHMKSTFFPFLPGLVWDQAIDQYLHIWMAISGI